MLIYASLADYLNNKVCPDVLPQLKGSDRPILVLEGQEKLATQYPFLMERQTKVYEIGFPWVQVADWENHKAIRQNITVEIEAEVNICVEFQLTDEVLDETQISNDEDTAQALKELLGVQCDRTTAEIITLFISLFDHMRGEQNHGSQSSGSILRISDTLTQLSDADARLPLVLALNRRYDLRHKLELIAPKLRSQLTRTAELMPLGHIQEMDAYCLRDYVRRPGRKATEKAGARQQLMGIKRYHSFNTPENRFLKGFCDLLHLDCRDYHEFYAEARLLERAIDRFRQESSVQEIPRTNTFLTKANYVLQQNPIYRSFYQAYLDYAKRRTEKENIWSFRQALLVDVVTVVFVASLLNLEGSYVPPTASINIRSVPIRGEYLLRDTSTIVNCILQSAAITFEISHPTKPVLGDLQLKVSVQSFSDQTRETYRLPVWIYWYKPSKHIAQIKKKGIYIYLFDRQDKGSEEDLNPEDLTCLKLPHPLNESLIEGMQSLTNLLWKLMESFL
ncbi:DUF2357 domain-containing protein [Lyngbya confervoides]|uniref:DUF2357 domain-containing protein n=1 Tax=Lyngbya confervoides BDU141951 TaxID=1574623 RepID=A0ABD4T0D5_9CYAN|nr:DUF2357 domain-containing protein [Lyngbya confervoides]MCM1982027.1 DUF2357 domain-containing protein [Lyngbya confervoides BDU141951]